jgi:hypothetical protein
MSLTALAMWVGLALPGDAPALHPVDLLEPLEDSAAGAPGPRPLAWWRTLRGQPQLEVGPDGPVLVLAPPALIEQPVAAPADAPFEFSGRLVGRSVLVLTDGAGGRASASLESEGDKPLEVRLDRAWFEEQLGRPPVPRYTLSLTGFDEAHPARWSELSLRAQLPAPDEAQLADLLDARVTQLFERWLERSLDDVGPRATAFIAHLFDTDTGERVGAPLRRTGYHPLYAAMLQVHGVRPRPAWEAALGRYLEDFLTLGLHPRTGLPRTYDPLLDTPLDDEPLEIGIHLRFLLDVAEIGPESFRERALAAASRIGEHVLSAGALPTGEVAPKYRPSDGRPFLDTVPLRRLDVPAQLARLGARIGDERYLRVAREAVRTLEYAHHWSGTWDRIDPGFDDDYGHYGERAVTMWEAWPEEPAFRELALSGWRTFAPLWRNAVRHGGNVAADQVRCWHIAARIAVLEPELEPEVRALVDAAARLHFKGGQGGDGVWVDVTIFGFDPQRLPVGDTAGVPHNLLEGLAVIHQESLGLATPETRARYMAVLEATDRAFGGAYGHIDGARRREGANAENPAIGSLRLLPALVEMLVHLQQ